MTNHAKGEFDVALVPLTDEEVIPGFGRMTINKEFHGDLEGSSKGQMLSAKTSEPTSAGYVAVERVEGTLDSRTGSFFLQHKGLLDKGASIHEILIVPDSGTDELTGITGALSVEIKDGKH